MARLKEQHLTALWSGDCNQTHDVNFQLKYHIHYTYYLSRRGIYWCRQEHGIITRGNYHVLLILPQYILKDFCFYIYFILFYLVIWSQPKAKTWFFWISWHRSAKRTWLQTSFVRQLVVQPPLSGHLNREDSKCTKNKIVRVYGLWYQHWWKTKTTTHLYFIWQNETTIICCSFSMRNCDVTFANDPILLHDPLVWRKELSHW